jgi:hypothetical protein
LPCSSWMTDASTALDATALLVAIATALSAAELLAIRREFRSHGLFDPVVLRSTRPGLLTEKLTMVSMPRVAAAQLVLGITVLLLLAFGATPAIAFLGLAVAVILQRFLLPYGGDGSDYMACLLTITVAIAFLLGVNSVAARIALAFIGAQLCLAYGASGVAKLFGRPWRAGNAVQLILHTGFGHAGVVRTTLDRSPSTTKLLTWLVIGFEIAFPIGILLGGWVALGALVAAGVFQVSIAVSMGLNRFTPWFLAAFPATVWSACHYGVLS